MQLQHNSKNGKCLLKSQLEHMDAYKHITLANLLKDFPMSNIDQNHSFKRNELYPVHLLQTSKIIFISYNLMTKLGKIIHLPPPPPVFEKKKNLPCTCILQQQ